jgi:hypothetical protein
MFTQKAMIIILLAADAGWKISNYAAKKATSKGVSKMVSPGA